MSLNMASSQKFSTLRCPLIARDEDTLNSTLNMAKEKCTRSTVLVSFAARTDPVFNHNLRSGLSITVSALEPKSTGRHHLAFPPLI